jgi:enterochelin esterase-like enzyme
MKRMMHRISIQLLLLLTLVPNVFANNAKPFESLAELRKEMKGVVQSGQADSFWTRVVVHKVMPLIFDQNVIFFWRGDAKSVEWRGDFSSWDSAPENHGKRLGKTNIWFYEQSLPRDARLDYKLVLNRDDWQLDPLNPNQQLGGFGPNSEVRMPDWKMPATVIRRDGVESGKLGNDIPFKSAKLGYTLNYRIYTPPNFNPSTSKDLPVLYVTDGSDYWNDGMGSLVIILDNLLAEKRIVPVLVVFIDPWDRKANENRREKELIPAVDRKCTFCEFIVDELIPIIESNHPAKRSREGRAILGTSLGGMHATLMVTRYAALFGMAGVQSPAFGSAPWLLEDVDDVQLLPLKVFVNAGSFEGRFAGGARKLNDILKQRNVDVQYMEVPEGHSWGHWRALLDDMLLFFYGK